MRNDRAFEIVDAAARDFCLSVLTAEAASACSLSAHRVLSRIEVEFAHHGGTDNGDLPVTYDNFVAYGIDRHSVSPALSELKALGIIGIKPGRAGNAEWRAPNRFRLTYRHTDTRLATHEWRKIETIPEALEIARRARSKRENRQTDNG